MRNVTSGVSWVKADRTVSGTFWVYLAKPWFAPLCQVHDAHGQTKAAHEAAPRTLGRSFGFAGVRLAQFT